MEGKYTRAFFLHFSAKNLYKKEGRKQRKIEENPGIIQPLYLLGRCNPAKWNISVPYLLAIDELGIVDFIKVVIDPCPHYLLLAHRANTPGTAYHASCSCMKWTLQTSFPGGLEGMSRCTIPLFTLFSLPPSFESIPLQAGNPNMYDAYYLNKNMTPLRKSSSEILRHEK